MNKVLFLDRDGVVNKDYGYVHKINLFHFMPYIFDLCRAAIAKNYRIIIVTNQAGIARGFYSERDFLDLTSRVESIFLDNCVNISQTYYCPHHPVFGLGSYKKNCKCRKPEPGMFKLAAKEFDINMCNSVMIGDNISDLQAANSAGVGELILIGSVKEDIDKAFSHTEILSLKDAIKLI